MGAPSLVRVGALEPFAGLLRSAGLPLRPHFESAAIPEELLARPDSLITKHQLYRFLDSIAKHAGIRNAGVLAGEQLEVDNLGPAGVAMRKAPTLLDACRVFGAFIDRFVEGNSIWVEEPGDGTAWLLNRVEGGPAPGKEIADHGAIPMLTSVVRLVAGADWIPGKIQLQTARAPLAFLDSPFSEAEIRFWAPATGVQFPACFLPLPPRALTTSEPDGLPGDLPESTGGRVEGLVRGHLRVGVPLNLAQVSEISELAPRTLRRRLADEGLTFRSAVERSRFRLAREYLADPELKIEAIARHLGYSGSNNFVRAFRRMSGFTPTEYRRRDPNPS